MADWKFHDLQLGSGLATKIVPEKVMGAAALQASNMDGFDTFLGIGKLPGSTALNSDAGAGQINSIHYFEYFDLDRTSKRACVVNTLDGGIAGRLKTVDLVTGARTTLFDDNGLEAFSAAESLAGATMNHRLHLSSPNQKGSNVPTGGRKFDGSRITNWGVLAPGQDSNTLQDLTDSAVWTAAFVGGAGTKSTLTNTIRGAGSVGIRPVGATTQMRLSRAFGATNIDPNGSTLLRLWLFIPSGGLQDLAASAVEVRFISTAVTFLSVFRFTRGALVPGWNLLSMDLDVRFSQGTMGPVNAAACTSIELDINLLGSNVIADWAWNFLSNLERGEPAAAIAAGTAFAAAAVGATFSFRATFLTEYGLESNAGPVSNTVMTSGGNLAINVTAVPISSDPSVIARRIYAIKNATGGYGFVVQIDDNSTTVTPLLDGGYLIGSDGPPLAGDIDLDASPPEPFLDVVAFNNRVFAVDAATRLNLLPSELGQSEAFPIVNAIQVDDPISAIRDHPNGLLVYTSDKTFQLTGSGTGTSPFSLDLVNSELGSNGPRSVASAQGVNVAVREKQVYLVPTPDSPWYLNGPVQDQWDSGMDGPSLGDMFVVSDRGRFRVVFFGKSAGGAFDQIWSYQHTTQMKSDTTNFEGGVDPQDLRNGSWFKIALPSGITPLCAVIGERSSEVPELWVGTTEGYVHVFQNPITTNWFTQNGNVAVSATWESADVSIGLGPDGVGLPGYVMFNHVNPGGTPTTWDVTVTVLTGANAKVLGSVTFQVIFPVGATARRIRIPDIGFPASASWARVKLVNNNTSEGGVFRVVRLYFSPTLDFTGATDT